MYRLFAGILLLASAPSTLLATSNAPAPTPAPAYTPGTLKLASGQINPVMVLGTPHLSNLPKSFDMARLDLLKQRLAAWKPQAIAIEELSGLQCAYLQRYPSRYRATVEAYCPDTTAAQAATGLDTVAAYAQAEQLLDNWPASPSAGQRRKLAALFMAAGEPASAAVQWLRLPTDERRSGDGLDAALVASLNALPARRDETYMISVPLAVQAGLERLHAMDDHTADRPIGDETAYGAAIIRAWDNPVSAELKRIYAVLQGQLDTPEGVLAMYRSRNDPAMVRLAVRSDFGAALEEPSAQHYGRDYVTSWETRNLRMAANVRDTMVPAGRRTLVVVGASHKAYLEAYLQQMHDVEIASVEDLLR